MATINNRASNRPQFFSSLLTPPPSVPGGGGGLDPFFASTSNTAGGNLPSTQVGQGYMASPPRMSPYRGGGGPDYTELLRLGDFIIPGLGTGLDFVADMFQINQQGSQRDWQGGQNERDRRQRISEMLAGMAAGDQADERARLGLSLQGTQMDPVAGPRHLFRAGAQRQLAERGPAQVGPGFRSNLSFADSARQFMNDDALSEAAMRFYSLMSQINPDGQPANMGAMGLDAGYQPYIDQARDNAIERRSAINRQRRSDLFSGIDPESRRFFNGGNDYFTRNY